MDNFSFGVALGLRKQAEGTKSGLRDALEACQIYKARISELELALAVKTAHAGGLEAQLAAYAEVHPESPLRSDSGRRYRKSGNAKTVGRLRYETAFDRIARDHGIADPVVHRAD